MENASKALLLAGGVLVAIIIIAILVYVFSAPSAMQDELTITKNAEQLEAFNSGYEAYNKKAMRGLDIITLINKARDNNIKNPEQRVDIVVSIDTSVSTFDGLTESSYTFTDETTNDYEKLLNGKTEDTKHITQFKSQRYFKCTKIEYKAGRIIKMTFEDITSHVLANMSDYTDITRGESSLPEQ